MNLNKTKLGYYIGITIKNGSNDSHLNLKAYFWQ